MPSTLACEVLGCLAPFLHSGPHRAQAIRRRLRMEPEAFARAVRELERTGAVQVRGADELWLTPQGERTVAGLFG